MASKLGDATLLRVAEQTGKTGAQVMIRWSLQKGFLPLPKSADPSRIAENIDVFDFQLSEAQMAELDALDSNFVTAWDPTETNPV